MVPVARSTSFFRLSTSLTQRLARYDVIHWIKRTFGCDRHRIHPRYLILELLLDLLLLCFCISFVLISPLLPHQLLVSLPLKSSLFYCLDLLNLSCILILCFRLLLHLLVLLLISHHLLNVIIRWRLWFRHFCLMMRNIDRKLSLYT